MMSAQTSTQTSQIQAPEGDGIKKLTCRSVRPQKEQRRILSLVCRLSAIANLLVLSDAFIDHAVDDAVGASLIGRHKVVTFCIAGDFFHGLTGVSSEDGVHLLASA